MTSEINTPVRWSTTVDDPHLWDGRVTALNDAIRQSQALADQLWNNREKRWQDRQTGSAASPSSQDAIDDTIFRHETAQIRHSIHLLAALRDFADTGLTFFRDGYYGDKQGSPATLQVDEGHPPPYVMRTLLDQVSFDIGVLQMAGSQRGRVSEKATQQGLALWLADNLAEQALQPALAAGFLPASTSVLSYLAQRMRTRLVPYAHTILISVAYASVHHGMAPSRDYLAIPHEIGHHVYWNGRVPETKQRVFEALYAKAAAAGLRLPTHSRKGDWRLRWLEEIFADCYALLVGGPVVALDFQDLLDDDQPGHFREDNDKHPIPELRPLLQNRILRRLTDQQGQPLYPHTPERLDAQWLAYPWVGQSVYSQEFRIHGKRQKMTGQAILDSLDPLVNLILDVLQDMRPADRDTARCWSADLNFDDPLGKLYTDFTRRIRSHETNAEISFTLELTQGEENLATHLDKKFAARSQTFKAHIEEIMGRTPNQLSTSDWVQLFLFQGWSDEGPLESIGGG